MRGGKFDSVYDAFSVGFRIVYAITYVVVHGGTNIPAGSDVGFPGRPFCGFVVCYDFCTW